MSDPTATPATAPAAGLAPAGGASTPTAAPTAPTAPAAGLAPAGAAVADDLAALPPWAQKMVTDLRAENAQKRITANAAVEKLAAHEAEQAKAAQAEAVKRGEFEKLYQAAEAEKQKLSAQVETLKVAAEQLKALQQSEVKALEAALPAGAVAALGLSDATPLETRLALLRAVSAGTQAAAAQATPAVNAPAGRTGATVSTNKADAQARIDAIFEDPRISTAEKQKLISELQRSAYGM